jgi:hypothetical protein
MPKEHTGGRHRITETRPGSMATEQANLQAPHHTGQKVNRTMVPRGPIYGQDGNAMPGFASPDVAAQYGNRPLTLQQQAWFDDYTKRGK